MNRRQLLGVILLVLSTVAWTLALVVPFFSLKATTKIATVTGLIVVGEVTFYPGLALLGKEAVTAMKAGWGNVKSRLGVRGGPKPD